MSIINNVSNNVPSTIKDGIRTTFDMLSLDFVLSTVSNFYSIKNCYYLYL